MTKEELEKEVKHLKKLLKEFEDRAANVEESRMILIDVIGELDNSICIGHVISGQDIDQIKRLDYIASLLE